MFKRLQEDRALMILGIAALTGFSITLGTILASLLL